MKINSKWIIFYQTLHDDVCFQTSEMSKPSYKDYKDFVKFITNIPQYRNISGLLDALDKFYIVTIDLINGSWKKEEPYKTGEVSFKELVDLNKEKKEPSSTKNIIKDLKNESLALLRIGIKDNKKGKKKNERKFNFFR